MIHQSSTPSPTTELLKGVWDIKEWTKQFLNPLKGHSKYLVFRFTKDSAGKTEMHCKWFSTDPWEPKEHGVRVLSVSSCWSYVTHWRLDSHDYVASAGLPDIVNASPLVEPSTAKINLERLLQDWLKYKP